MIMASEIPSPVNDDLQPPNLSAQRQQMRSAATGLACPKCGCRHVPDETGVGRRRASEVTHSEDIPDRIRRRRVCRNCDYRFTTVEMPTRDAA